jgi:hypothetical protein
LSPDQTLFFADLTPIADPSQREFLYGGLPIKQSFFRSASGTSRVLAFAVQPDAALQALIPFIRQGTGGALAGASVSPLIFATPAGSAFLTGSGSTKALQASLGIAAAGANQQSVIVVLVGDVVGNAVGRPSLEGVMHGSFLGNATGQPIRISSYYATPPTATATPFTAKTGSPALSSPPGQEAPAQPKSTRQIRRRPAIISSFSRRSQRPCPASRPAGSRREPSRVGLAGS